MALRKMKDASGDGYSLIEAIVVVGLLALLVLVSLPALARMQRRNQQTIAAQELKMLVQRGRMQALQRGVCVGIHFTQEKTGWSYRYYRDGNANGLTASDRDKGVDPPLGPAQPLDRPRSSGKRDIMRADCIDRQRLMRSNHRNTSAA